MTARQMRDMLDQRVSYRVPGTDLLVHGTVQDARLRFGIIDILFVPAAGSGSKWLQWDSVTLLDRQS